MMNLREIEVKHVVVCFRHDQEYNEVSFSHIAFVTSDLNIALKFKAENQDKYLGADVFLDVRIYSASERES